MLVITTAPSILALAGGKRDDRRPELASVQLISSTV
jgi:hypothetical protein